LTRCRPIAFARWALWHLHFDHASRNAPIERPNQASLPTSVARASSASPLFGKRGGRGLGRKSPIPRATPTHLFRQETVPLSVHFRARTGRSRYKIIPIPRRVARLGPFLRRSPITAHATRHVLDGFFIPCPARPRALNMEACIPRIPPPTRCAAVKRPPNNTGSSNSKRVRPPRVK